MSQLLNQLKKNLAGIQEKAQEAKLVAVSKYVDADMMKLLYEAGVRRMAENRPKDFLEKQDRLADLSDDIEWHYIGRLQRRPVKDIINRIDYLHSLDRMSLVKEIEKRAEKTIKCFLQVNIAEEEGKAGFQVNEVFDAIEEIKHYPKIELVGLMTMAPREAEGDELHHIFSSLQGLRKQVEDRHFNHAPCHELSMGMSRDYQIAVQHGATYIRVGSAIFKNVGE